LIDVHLRRQAVISPAPQAILVNRLIEQAKIKLEL